MDTRLLGYVVRLRYRLLWANWRSRNGRIALFLTGYLLVALLAILLGFGGFASAFVAIRAGKAELVARAVLSGFFFNALMTAVILGVGMNPAFADAALRRFPLNALERLVARHFTGFLEPLWLCVMALNLGLAAGFSLLGIAPIWLTVPGALLVALANYLLARFALSVVERLAATRWGPMLLLLAIVGTSVLPGLLAPYLVHNSEFVAAAEKVLSFTPSFAGAAVMSGAAPAAMLLLVLWCAALGFAVALVDRIPIPTGTVAKAKASWDGLADRLAAPFGPELAPIVAKTFRFYMRSNRVRMNVFFTLPMLCVLTAMGRDEDPFRMFFYAVGLIATAGFIGTANMSVNAFGCDGSGFRRYFLWPVAPDRAVRAVSYSALAVGAATIPVALLAWAVLAPVPTDGRMWTMLLSSSLCGLFLFQGLAVWTSLLAPRRTVVKRNFGNDLSLAANVLVIGGIMLCILVPQLLSHRVQPQVFVSWWWVGPPLAAAAFAFYSLTLRAGGAVFLARRERLLAAIEGRG